jgi:chromosome partitioning protein
VAISNKKGGTGKTATAISLGVALASQGKKVLLVDADSQGNLTTALGWKDHGALDVTLATHMQHIIDDRPIGAREGILHHAEGVDVMPGGIELSGIETGLVNALSREYVMKRWVDEIKSDYDFAIIDCSPSLGMTTINALAAANSVIIPVQTHYLPAEGMVQLVSTIKRIRQHINPRLKIDGVLLTFTDERTNLSRQITAYLKDTYGGVLRIYDARIPMSVKVAETSAWGKSIFTHDKSGKAAAAYAAFAKEVARDGERRRDSLQPSLSR